MNGTAFLNGSVAQVRVPQGQGAETRRVDLVNATRIVGNFAAIRVTGDEQRQGDGSCVSYFVASTDQIGGDLSVLVAPKSTACKSGASQRWVVGGVVIGLIGGLVIGVGLMYVFRDIVERWARRPADDEAGTYLV